MQLRQQLRHPHVPASTSILLLVSCLHQSGPRQAYLGTILLTPFVEQLGRHSTTTRRGYAFATQCIRGLKLIRFRAECKNEVRFVNEIDKTHPGFAPFRCIGQRIAGIDIYASS